MKEYIERAAAIEAIRKYQYPYGVEFLLSNIPAADVAPVRHGRWLTTDAYPHHLYCSVCYKTYAKNVKWIGELDLPVNYCPSCGALMDKEDEHDKHSSNPV